MVGSQIITIGYHLSENPRTIITHWFYIHHYHWCFSSEIIIKTTHWCLKISSPTHKNKSKGFYSFNYITEVSYKKPVLLIYIKLT